jgi:RNA polymerase sigma-70 factor (ECF subfamily)
VALKYYITLYQKKQTLQYDSRRIRKKTGSILPREIEYNYEREEQIKLMYKAVYQLILKALVFA